MIPCPKCHGQMFPNWDNGLSCLQCSYVHYLDARPHQLAMVLSNARGSGRTAYRYGRVAPTRREAV